MKFRLMMWSLVPAFAFSLALVGCSPEEAPPAADNPAPAPTTTPPPATGPAPADTKGEAKPEDKKADEKPADEKKADEKPADEKKADEKPAEKPAEK